DRGMDSIQPKIPTNNTMIVLRLRTVAAQDLHLLSTLSIISDHHTAIADCPQVFRREERETPVVSNRAGAAPLVFRAYRLGGVFDYDQPMFLSKAHDWIHVRHLPKQVHGDNGASLLCDLCCDLLYIEVVARRIDVNEDRRSPQPGNRANCRKERIGRSDDLVA